MNLIQFKIQTVITSTICIVAKDFTSSDILEFHDMEMEFKYKQNSPYRLNLIG